ncbi:MAG: ABC transporter ATP-binding protein [Gammaproteobacteria bacterium]|nr:ABC transporter ATP-binding protein [Gammaproteobacteria bacterium]
MNQAVIDLQNVEFAWTPAGAPVLRLEHLSVAKGERMFLKGPSGSGKSTLLNLLGGVTVPRRGTVKVLNQDLGALSAAARDRFRAEHVGYIFQLFNLVPYLSVLDNVLLPLRFSRARRERVRQRGGPRAEAGRLIIQLGLGADLLDRPATELSVGQQQRVAAARALIGGPELVVADEPTSALDADTRALFIRLLMDECATQGATLVFVSHDASLEPLFDRGVALNDINHAGRSPHVVDA